MTFETGLSFGRNAKIINEAYSKLYSKNNNSVNEARGTPSDEELMMSELSDKQKEYIKNFDAEKEYDEYRKAEQKRREQEREEANDEIASGESDADDTSGAEEGEDEDAKTFMSSYGSRKGDRESNYEPEFYFSPHRNVSTSRYPDWILSGAKKAVLSGQSIPAGIRAELFDWIEAEISKRERTGMDIPQSLLNAFNDEKQAIENGTSEKGRKPESTVSSSRYSQSGGNGSKDSDELTEEEQAENVLNTIIGEYPETFNEEYYDLGLAFENKVEVMNKTMALMEKGFRDDDALSKALAEIPGCEKESNRIASDIKSLTSDENPEEDYVGDIDSEDSSSEDDETFKSVWDMSGFGVVIKNYERLVGSEYDKPRFQIRYVTPENLKGVTFETEDEAIDAARETLKEYVGDITDVSIAVVLDNSIIQKIHNSKDGMEDVLDVNGNQVISTKGINKGKPMRRKIQATVYTISTSDEENTSRCLSYESGDWKSKHECDEYLQ